MTEKLNLHQKIRAVMKDVEYLSKDGNVAFKTTNYKAITEEKVTSAVRTALVEHGLVILPINQEFIKEGTLTTVNTQYKIIDVDTGDSEIIVSTGQGVDTQDKGIGKAMTYAYKYLLLRTFAIPTGEDPDKISSAELDAQQEKKLEEERKKRATLAAKWNAIGGKTEVFDAWLNGELRKGQTLEQVDKFLTQKVTEKNEAGSEENERQMDQN